MMMINHTASRGRPGLQFLSSSSSLDDITFSYSSEVNGNLYADRLRVIGVINVLGSNSNGQTSWSGRPDPDCVLNYVSNPWNI